jgi:hypothetical protein
LGEYFPADRSGLMMVDMHPVQLKGNPFVRIIDHQPRTMADLLFPIPFHRRRPLPVGRDFSFMVAKSDEFLHRFFKYAQPAVFRQKSEFYGQENVC